MDFVHERRAIDLIARAEPRMSWVDALIAAIDRLPVATWIVYVTAAVLAVLAAHLLLWVSGARPAGQFGLQVAVLAAWPIVFLAAFDYLNRVAERAVSKFRPATDLSEVEARSLVLRLTRMPPLAAWLSLPVGALWIAGLLATDPTFYGMLTGQGPLDAVLKLLGWIHSVETIVATFRFLLVLVIVYRSHELITHVDLFSPQPLFAFSAFTVRIALFVLLMTYLYILAFPTVTLIPLSYVYVVGVAAPLAIAQFILPLLGIHEEMLEEKQSLRAAIRRRIEKTIDAIHEAMDDEPPDLVGIPVQKDLLGALLAEEEYVAKRPTWPWDPNTLRSLLIAVLLPMGLFVAQKLLAQILGL